MMEQIDSYVILVMSKRTVVSVLTVVDWAKLSATWTSRAKLSLVLIRVIELLNTIMSIRAVIAIRTVLISCDELANLCCVAIRQTAAIFILIMIVYTTFWVVSLGSRAMHRLISF